MKTAQSGPLFIYGDRNPTGTGSGGSVNPDKSPSIAWGGWGLMDYRAGYNRTRAGIIGVWTQACLDITPAALATASVAALQATTAATAMTLVSSPGSGIAILGTATQFWSSGTIVPVNALIVGQAPALLSFGLASVASNTTSASFYDPTTMTARTISVTSAADFSANTFTVRGFDIYGNAMTEAITGPNATTVNGKKAFKFVTSVTPTLTNASTASIGTSDIFGLPLRVDSLGYLDPLFYNAAVVTAVTGFVAADATSPATTTTGDVRGTYAVQSASDGTKRLTLGITPAIKNISAGNATAFFGVTQV